MTKNAEDTPYIKEHDGKTICFADTIGQAVSALKRENMPGADKDKLQDGHLMLFGVEKWDNTQLKSMKGAMKAATNTFQRLEVFGCEMTKDDQTRFADALGGLTTVTTFDLDNTVLERDGAKAIFKRVADAPRIERLNLQGSLTKDGVVAAMAESLEEGSNVFKALKDLDLKINDIKSEGGQPIADVMRRLQPHDEVKVDLFYNNLGGPGAAHVANALAKECSVTYLDLCCNSIGDEGAEAIATALRTNDRLHTLKLALNNIGNKGAISLFEALTVTKASPGNETLKFFDISANVMNINYAEQKKGHQAAMDAENKLFPELRKKQAEIEDEHGALSDEALAHNAMIEDKCLQHVQKSMGVASVLGVLCTLLANNKLEEIDFTGIEMDNSGWDYFVNTLPALRKRDDQCKIKFSIVDCMNEENLKTVENVIWGDHADNFPFIDWRRKDAKKEEKK